MMKKRGLEVLDRLSVELVHWSLFGFVLISVEQRLFMLVFRFFAVGLDLNNFLLIVDVRETCRITTIRARL